MIEFKRNEETGILEAFKDGEKIGIVDTMGDDVLREGAPEDGSDVRDSRE